MYRWSGIRVHDLNVARDQLSFLAVTEKKILKYSLVGGTGDEELKLLDTVVESDPITSVFVGRDPRFALVSLSTQEIHLWFVCIDPGTWLTAQLSSAILGISKGDL